MFASNSPEHIVGNHVLHRLCVPRYPPLALISLTKIQLVIMQTRLKFYLYLCLQFYSLHYAVFKVLWLEIYPAVWQLT
jgi:hypothetical protein